jgi:hypothetical protein
MSKPMIFFRKPLPDLPAGARARIGALMRGKKFELVETKKLEPGWADEMKGYISIAKTDIVMTAGEQAEEWLATLQVVGKDQPTLDVLRKGSER